MKKLINVLVYAEDEEDALCKARVVVHKKIEHSKNGGEYIYYVDFYKDESKQFGKDRGISIPPILQVSTSLNPTDDRRGLDMVNSVIEANRKRFKQIMACIRHYVTKYTDDQIFDTVESIIDIKDKSSEDTQTAFRYYCEIASGYHQGTDAKLYDFNGNAIWIPRHLHDLLNPSCWTLWYFDESGGQDPNWDEQQIWTMPLWAVPFLRIVE
jgi:hypothetical protein